MFQYRIEILAVECVSPLSVTGSSVQLEVNLQRRGACHRTGALNIPSDGSVTYPIAVPVPRAETFSSSSNKTNSFCAHVRNSPASDSFSVQLFSGDGVLARTSDEIAIDSVQRRVGVRWLPLFPSTRGLGIGSGGPCVRVRVMWSVEPEDGSVFAATGTDYPMEHTRQQQQQQQQLPSASTPQMGTGTLSPNIDPLTPTQRPSTTSAMLFHVSTASISHSPREEKGSHVHLASSSPSATTSSSSSSSPSSPFASRLASANTSSTSLRHVHEPKDVAAEPAKKDTASITKGAKVRVALDSDGSDGFLTVTPPEYRDAFRGSSRPPLTPLTPQSQQRNATAPPTSDSVETYHYFRYSTCQMHIDPAIAFSNLYASSATLHTREQAEAIEKSRSALDAKTHGDPWLMGKGHRLVYLQTLVEDQRRIETSNRTETVEKNMNAMKLGSTQADAARGVNTTLLGSTCSSAAAAPESFFTTARWKGRRSALAEIRSNPTSRTAISDEDANRLQMYGVLRPPLEFQQPHFVTFDVERAVANAM